MDRAVLVMHMDGLSDADIAEVTGASRGAVSVRLHRIRGLYTRRYLGD